MFKSGVILCALLGLVGSHAALQDCTQAGYVAAVCYISGKLPIVWYARGGSKCGCVVTASSAVTGTPLPGWLMLSISGGAKIGCQNAGGTLSLAQSSSDGSIKKNGVPIIDNQQCSATANGDPHLVGFDGTKFEFSGFPGGVFNLISERDHQVNVLLDDFGVAEATYIRDVGVKFGNVLSLVMTTKMASVGGEVVADTNVEVNGVQFAAPQMNSSSVFEFGGASKASVSVTKTEFGSDVLKVQTNALELVFQRNAGASHLDMSINVLSPVSMHGVLGQTMQWTEGSKFEGDEADYVVSNLLADDFKFNQFQGAAPAAGNSRALLGLPMPVNTMVKWRSIDP